ncbi:MAG: aminoacyl-tRNA hydrolase [Bacteroidales bacterium]|nr:aminoacyl-tRNA hydrolase [Bacteroidales bacterium]MBN2819390.1 aminoacyl-tRNA hydrolase [Bacteroidales bacterium]
MKYLIVGLGNIGSEYHNTRHNIGFKILDALAGASNISFEDKRYGMVAEFKHRGRTFVLVKPSTYMNRSGMAVSYWLKQAKVPVDRMLVLVDDIALPFGSIRIRPKGGDGGHNGLANISQVIGHSNYARVRFGIGDDFHKGQQVNHVLGEWSKDEEKELPELIDHSIEIIKGFGTVGLELTMTRLNKK